MQQFTIRENGNLSDTSVLSSIEDMRDDVPDLNPTAVEAHMMLFKTYGAYLSALSSRLEDIGLSHARFNMLRWLHHAEDHRLTMSELGAHLEASVPNVIRMVQALETKGWVRRVPSDSDRRVMYVELTHEGHRRFRAVLPHVIRLWEEIQGGLNADEQEMLSHLLAKLRVSLFSRYIGKDLVAYRIAAKKKREADKSKGQDLSPPK